MSEPIRTNLSGIYKQAVPPQSSEALQKQVRSNAKMVEEVQDPRLTPMGRGVDRRLQTSTRALGDRGVRTQSGATKEAVKGVEERAKGQQDLAQEFADRNPQETPAELLRNLKRSLRPGATPEEILSQAKLLFDDPYLVDVALEYLEKATEGGMHDAVVEARAQYSQSEERKIRAGAAITPAILDFFKEVKEAPAEMRALYRDVVIDQPREFIDLYRELKQRFPEKQRQAACKCVSNAIGYHIKVAGSGVERAQLIAHHRQLRNLQAIETLDRFFHTREKAMRKHAAKEGSIVPSSFDSVKMAEEYLKICSEPHPTVLRVMSRLHELHFDAGASEALIAEYKRATRTDGVPPQLFEPFGGDKRRQRLHDILLDTMERIRGAGHGDDEETY